MDSIKNKLKRPISMFGKVIPVWILVTVLSAAIGSAALVGYISNTIKTTVTVSSPIELWISADGQTYGKTDLTASIFGGETYSIWIQSKNHANVEINGNVQVTCTNTGGVICSDFSAVKFNDADVSSYCSSVDDTHVKFVVPASWTANQVETVSKTDVTFKADASGDYVFEGLITP